MDKNLIKNISKLFSASILAQLIQIIALPLISRLYSPEEFSLYAQINATVLFFAVFATLQMHLAVVIEMKNKRDLLVLGVVSSIFVSVFALIISFLSFVQSSGNTYLSSVYIAFCVFLLVISLSCANLYRGVLNSLELYNIVSKYLLFRAICIVFFQLIFYYLFSYLGLVIGVVLAEISTLIFFHSFIRGGLPLNILANLFNFKWIGQKIKQNKEFAIFGSLQESVSVFSAVLPLYIIPVIYGGSSGGQFAMAHRLIWAATVALSVALSQVTLRRYSIQNEKPLVLRAFSDFKYLMLVLILLAPIGFHVAPNIIGLILGGGWEGAGLISRYIILWSVIFLISVPFRVIIRIEKYQLSQLKLEVIFVFIYLLFFFYFESMAFYTMVVLFCLISCLHNISIIIMTIYLSSKKNSIFKGIT